MPVPVNWVCASNRIYKLAGIASDPRCSAGADGSDAGFQRESKQIAGVVRGSQLFYKIVVL